MGVEQRSYETRGRRYRGHSRPLVAVVVCIAAMTGACAPEATERTGEMINQTPTSALQLVYADVQQKSAHNSFARHEAIVDQLVYHRVRSLELDLHVGKRWAGDLPRNWFVYHTDVVDDETSCRTLVDCLEPMLAFADAVPEHEVITLWLDLKDDWDEDHRPDALDDVLHKALGDRLITPDDVVHRCPGAASLMDAVSRPDCGWPTLAGMRGQFVVALTGGGVADPSTVLSTYLRDGELAFVAPSVGTPADVDALPQSVAIANVGLCSNLVASALGRDCDVDSDALAAIETAGGTGRVVRAWGIDSEESWDDAVAAGVHHLGTDFVNYDEDRWATTHNDAGWPFSCGVGCDAAPELGTTIALQVRSGDLWERRDAFGFASLDSPRDAEWTAMVSTVNSHVEDYAKGCLMARTSMKDDAAYFAVCRPADMHPARAQVRPDPGARTDALEKEVVEPGTVAPDAAAWLRLVVNNEGHCASGYAAVREGKWVHLGSQCFDDPLVQQGLAASSHDDDPVQFVFVGATRNGAAVKIDDLKIHAIGDAALSVGADPVP